MAGSSGPPYPDPVGFDQARADETIVALRVAVQKLREVSTQRTTDGNQALLSWLGPEADRFTQHMDGQHRDAAALLDELIALIGSIQGGKDAALQLQRRHDQANDQWRLDQARSTNRAV
jgi:hypothetical protein